MEPDDPVRLLISTILSQNTNDTNRDRAFESLLAEFGDLDAVQAASAADVADAIRVGGLQQQKARSIIHALRRIAREQGRLSLDFLGDLPVSEAMAWLLSIHGVGEKTAGIVLLFGFGKPYFPVDTHIRRVATRLGWIDPGGNVHRKMNDQLPDDPALLQALHLLLIQLGRRLCHPKNPECGECPLAERCAYVRASQRSST